MPGFLDLPVELQLEILEYILCEEKDPPQAISSDRIETKDALAEMYPIASTRTYVTKHLYKIYNLPLRLTSWHIKGLVDFIEKRRKSIYKIDVLCRGPNIYPTMLNTPKLSREVELIDCTLRVLDIKEYASNKLRWFISLVVFLGQLSKCGLSPPGRPWAWKRIRIRDVHIDVVSAVPLEEKDTRLLIRLFTVLNHYFDALFVHYIPWSRDTPIKRVGEIRLALNGKVLWRC
jgi:hypothetical protein